MGWSEYARSKTPLKLVLIVMAAVLVNGMIVEVLRLALWFRYEEPTDVAALTQMNEEYEHCTILDSFLDDNKITLWDSDHTAFLLETQDGQRKLAVVEKHFLLDRYRYCEKFSGDVPYIPELEDWQSVTTGTTHHATLTWIRDRSVIESFTVGQNYGPGISLIIIPMIIAEYIAYCLLFKREEIM